MWSSIAFGVVQYTVHVYGWLTGGWIYSIEIFNSKSIIRHISSLQRKLTYHGIGNSAKANGHSPDREALNQLCEAVHEAVPLSRRKSSRYNEHVLSCSFDRPIIHSFVKFIIVCQAHYPSPFLDYSQAFHSQCEQSLALNISHGRTRPIPYSPASFSWSL